MLRAAVQVIFTAIPVLSAVIAITLLHEEPFHALGWAGAALIVAAGLAIARSSQADAAAAAAAVPSEAAAEEERPVTAAAASRRRSD